MVMKAVSELSGCAFGFIKFAAAELTQKLVQPETLTGFVVFDETGVHQQLNGITRGIQFAWSSPFRWLEPAKAGTPNVSPHCRSRREIETNRKHGKQSPAPLQIVREKFITDLKGCFHRREVFLFLFQSLDKFRNRIELFVVNSFRKRFKCQWQSSASFDYFICLLDRSRGKRS